MALPFLLLIADLALWYLFSELALLGEPLINIAMFGLAFYFFLLVMLEIIEMTLVQIGVFKKPKD